MVARVEAGATGCGGEQARGTREWGGAGRRRRLVGVGSGRSVAEAGPRLGGWGVGARLGLLRLGRAGEGGRECIRWLMDLGG
jgi:hypothetical protein